MANESLKRTPTSSGNRRVFTFSAWVKKNVATSSSPQSLLSGGVNASDRGVIDFDSPGGDIRFGFNNSSSWSLTETTSLFRDPSSWKNVVVSVNLVNADVSIYVNGIKQSSSSVSWPSIVNNVFNAAGYGMYIGSTYGQNSQMYNGQMFDVFWVDGQALTPDVFGFYKDGKGYQSSGSTQATDFRPGQWSPHSPRKIKTEIERKGGFGVNGFYLPMNDSSNFGADFHMTPNSIIKLKGEDLPQPRNGAPATSDAFVSQLREEEGTLGFDGVVAFDGNGDYLSIPSSSDFALGTGDWTIEYFAYPTSTTQWQRHFYLIGSNANQIEGIFANSNGISFGKTNVWAPTQVGHTINQWNHYALVHDSTNMRLYINGNQVLTSTDNFANENKSLHIGYSNSTFGGYFTGFMSNFRVVKGTARYTSNFTAPTEPLTNVTNTKLLCCNSSTSATASTVTPGTITANGGAFATRNEMSGSIVLAVPGISTATGSNLVTNGTFDTNTAGWTAGNSATLSVDSRRLKVTNGTSSAGWAYQAITVEVGKRYTVNLEGITGTSAANIRIGTSANSAAYGNKIGSGLANISLTATSTTLYVTLKPNSNTNGNNALFDNIVVKQEDAPRDYSADIKGSGSNKTLTPYGQVGVGYELGNYYGSALSFDASGDATRAETNADFNLGDGDYTIEGWFYRDIASSHSGSHCLWAIGGVNSEGTLSLFYENAYFMLRGRSPGDGAYTNIIYVTNHNIPVAQWNHICTERYNGVITVYLNGVAIQTNLSESTTVSQGYFAIGAFDTGGTYSFDGYIQDVRVYKGLAKYKGGFDVPKPYTPVGIESWRQVSDTCKNNFCTMNPLNHNNGTFANGNLTTSEPAANGAQIYATMGSNTGKWYYEAHVEDVGTPNTGGTLIGINPLIRPSSNQQNRTAYRSSGDIYNDSSGNSGSSSYAYVAGDTIGVAWDADNKRLWFAKNGTWLGSGDPAGNSNSNVNYTNTETQGPFIAYDNGTGAQVTHLNFGQNPSFSGQITAGTYTDGNGKGLFKYQPPTGFLALCEDNLPTPAIADPGKHMKTVLWTGDGSGRSITGLGFQPDLVWVKRRDGAAVRHYLFDSIRGPLAALDSADSIAEVSSSTWLQSFDSNGFSLGTSGGLNGSGNNYVAWCWKAGGPAVTNTDGSINAQVSANQTAGFSIVSYTGNGTSGTTVGHGLGKTPNIVICKNRTDASTNWSVNGNFGGLVYGTNKLVLQGNGAIVSDTNEVTGANATTITLGNSSATNDTNDAQIAYCWTEIEGFSKFGIYTGNGSADGSFVYCGFKPAWVMIKQTNDNNNWHIADSSRKSVNPVNMVLRANVSNAESANNTGFDIDFLSNGFKLRSTNDELNENTSSYIFMAFAESPFQTANAK